MKLRGLYCKSRFLTYAISISGTGFVYAEPAPLNTPAGEQAAETQQEEQQGFWMIPAAQETANTLEVYHRNLIDAKAKQLVASGVNGMPIDTRTAQHMAWLEVEEARKAAVVQVMESRLMQDLLDAADNLNERRLLGMWTPRFIYGLAAALAEHHPAFQFRRDGRDERRAAMMTAVLEDLNTDALPTAPIPTAKGNIPTPHALPLAHAEKVMSGQESAAPTGSQAPAPAMGAPVATGGTAAPSEAAAAAPHGIATSVSPARCGTAESPVTPDIKLTELTESESVTAYATPAPATGNDSYGYRAFYGSHALRMAEPMLTTAADSPSTDAIDVADGTTQSVVNPTTVSSISLGVGSTLYVSDTLTLQQGGTLSVKENGTLLVKDGGKVILDKFTDGDLASAKLFDAFVKAAKTEGSGYIQINDASVQFGSNGYHLPIGKDNVNAVFGAHFEILNNLTLQNYWQGNHEKKPSLWVVGEGGMLHIMKNLTVDSYQSLVMKDGVLEVEGTAVLGHSGSSDYAAALDIQSGSVKLGQLSGAEAGASTVTMSGGTLQVTHEGNAFINGIGEVNLSGGTLVADGNNWTLNHTSSIGNIGVQTDAAHTITLGASGTTTTLTGDVTVSAGSNTMLNGSYAGTGSFVLKDGASLTLGQNFGTAAGSSVGLAGTGSVQVNWVGTPGSLSDGFTDSYDMSYSPAGLAGNLNLNNAADLVWKDAAGNTLHNVTYENGVLTGHVVTDPTVYHIVTAGHSADYSAGGKADGASAFLLHNDGAVSIGEGYSVTATQVTQNGHTLTLQGSGRYDLGTISKVQDIKLPNDLVLGNNWTGIISLDGQGKDLGFSSASWATWGMDGQGYRWDDIVRLDANGKAQSWLELSGIQSFFNPDGAYPYNHTIAANLIFAEGAALTINNGFGGRTITFTGDMAGTGTFEHTPAANETYKFSGDISAWTGKFLKSAGGTAGLVLSDYAHEVNAVIERTGGTLNLSIETDTKLNANVTVSDLAISAGKSVEVGRDAVVDISSKTYDGNTFASFTDAMYGAGEVMMKGNTFSPAAGEHDIRTNFIFNSEVRLGNNATTWHIKADAPTKEQPTPSVDGSLTVQNGDFFLLQQQTLSIEGGSVEVEKGSIWLGTGGIGSGIEMRSGSLSTQSILVNSAGNGTYATHITMSGGTLNITGDTFLNSKGLISASPVSLTGGTLLADNHAWTLNTNSTIGAVTVATQGEAGAVTFGKQGVTTTLTDMVENRGTLTLDGTVNLTMDVSNEAYGFIDENGQVNFFGVGFDAKITMPGDVYNVVSGNAAATGSNLTWTANGTPLTVVAESEKESAPDGALYFDGFNLRPVKDLDNPKVSQASNIYHMGARGEYTFSEAEAAAIVTGFELTGRGGKLVVSATPANPVSLDLAAGQLELTNGADITVGKDWSMEAGSSLVLGEGSVLTLPGLWGETTPNSYQNSYDVYHLLNNTEGEGKIVFDGNVSWQFGNAGHNTVSTGSYNILDEYGTGDGVNADFSFDVEVNGNMLIQNYRQGRDHPEVGSWWKVSEGGSLTVHGDLESSSYQKVSVEGGDLVVDGTYKIGHEAGREYEGDLELKSGTLSVGTFETVHEDTSTVHITGGKLTVTQEKAFANNFREVSAHDAEFDGSWTWNHDAAIGAVTVTEGSNITVGTASTTITLDQPFTANYGALTLDGSIIVNTEAQKGEWAYGTEETGYSPDGDGYYKRTDDLYSLVLAGNDAVLGANVSFTLNGETLSADDFRWDGKSIAMGGTEAGTVYYLNTDNGYSYTESDTRTTAFELLNEDATLRLERELSAIETIHAMGGTVALAHGVSMNAELLNAEKTVTMAGAGTYMVDGNALMAHPETHHVSFEDAAWTGTVQMSGQLGTDGTLNDLGNAGSWVEMQGVFGADSATDMNINVKLTDTAATAAWIYTGDGHEVNVNGNWAGNGTFVFAPVGGASQTLNYSGELDAWNGAFSAQGGTAQLSFSHQGGNTVAAAMQQKGGRLELTAATKTHFTNSTAAAAYIAAGGNLVADAADAAAVDTIRATGGDVTLKALAADTAVELQELVIGNSRNVTALAKGGEAAEAIIGNGGVLTAGEAASLHADLHLASGSTLELADRGAGLLMQHDTLSLAAGGGITLSDDMVSYLGGSQKLILFTGVDTLALGDAGATQQPITLTEHYDASVYFANLPPVSGGSYVLTYSGAEHGGVVAIEWVVPEPGTATLALTALAALFTRRRRKGKNV